MHVKVDMYKEWFPVNLYFEILVMLVAMMLWTFEVIQKGSNPILKDMLSHLAGKMNYFDKS